jgi:hypothetical protein
MNTSDPSAEPKGESREDRAGRDDASAWRWRFFNSVVIGVGAVVGILLVRTPIRGWPALDWQATATIMTIPALLWAARAASRTFDAQRAALAFDERTREEDAFHRRSTLAEAMLVEVDWLLRRLGASVDLGGIWPTPGEVDPYLIRQSVLVADALSPVTVMHMANALKWLSELSGCLANSGCVERTRDFARLDELSGLDHLMIVTVHPGLYTYRDIALRLRAYEAIEALKQLASDLANERRRERAPRPVPS